MLHQYKLPFCNATVFTVSFKFTYNAATFMFLLKCLRNTRLYITTVDDQKIRVKNINRNVWNKKSRY